ncbi:hypothetical protein CRG98_045255 [Punica granatum]|nr:hypothetical protein CRG98_045255 [Punica granatum]
MAFIGDSLARNQMESLLCLLSQVDTPVDIYKDSENRFHTWRFADHDFTLKVFWSRFLVNGEEIVINGTLSSSFELHVDRVDEKWTSELPGVDYAIISSGHWFFRKIYVYDGSNLTGCVYCNEPNVNSFGPERALGLALRSSMNHIKNCKNCKSGLVTVLRMFSPAHFENGTWNTGGMCRRTSPYTEREVTLDGTYLQFWKVQLEEFERVRLASHGGDWRRFGVLDITRAMLMRPDGHVGEFSGNKWARAYSDCLHWCLPGPIDVWNEFLMSYLRKLAR